MNDLVLTKIKNLTSCQFQKYILRKITDWLWAFCFKLTLEGTWRVLNLSYHWWRGATDLPSLFSFHASFLLEAVVELRIIWLNLKHIKFVNKTLPGNSIDFSVLFFCINECLGCKQCHSGCEWNPTSKYLNACKSYINLILSSMKCLWI